MNPTPAAANSSTAPPAYTQWTANWSASTPPRPSRDQAGAVPGHVAKDERAPAQLGRNDPLERGLIRNHPGRRRHPVHDQRTARDSGNGDGRERGIDSTPHEVGAEQPTPVDWTNVPAQEERPGYCADADTGQQRTEAARSDAEALLGEYHEKAAGRSVEDLKRVIDRVRATRKVTGTKTLMVLGSVVRSDIEALAPS